MAYHMLSTERGEGDVTRGQRVQCHSHHVRRSVRDRSWSFWTSCHLNSEGSSFTFFFTESRFSCKSMWPDKKFKLP